MRQTSGSAIDAIMNRATAARLSGPAPDRETIDIILAAAIYHHLVAKDGILKRMMRQHCFLLALSEGHCQIDLAGPKAGAGHCGLSLPN